MIPQVGQIFSLPHSSSEWVVVKHSEVERRYLVVLLEYQAESGRLEWVTQAAARFWVNPDEIGVYNLTGHVTPELVRDTLSEIAALERATEEAQVPNYEGWADKIDLESNELTKTLF